MNIGRRGGSLSLRPTMLIKILGQISVRSRTMDRGISFKVALQKPGRKTQRTIGNL